MNKTLLKARQAVCKRIIRTRNSWSSFPPGIFSYKKGGYAISDNARLIIFDEDIPDVQHYDYFINTGSIKVTETIDAEKFFLSKNDGRIANVSLDDVRKFIKENKNSEYMLISPSIHVDAKYMRDMLEAIPDTVIYTFGETSPISFYGSDARGVLMPVRVKNKKTRR